MMEDDQFVCKHCEKIIRNERPLFCPYCGKPVDPTEGLDLKESRNRIYPWSGVAPALMNLFLFWLIVVIPATWLGGRKVLIGVSILFALAMILSAFRFYLSDRSGEEMR